MDGQQPFQQQLETVEVDWYAAAASEDSGVATNSSSQGEASSSKASRSVAAATGDLCSWEGEAVATGRGSCSGEEQEQRLLSSMVEQQVD